MAFQSIDPNECMGDSLTKINLNAQTFDARITTLEGNVNTLQDDVVDINARIDSVFSPGMIMMWSGSVSNVPTGWALCNGQNGTPNLINRFIVGAGGSYQTGSTGGADTVKLTIAQIPSHNHGGVTGTDSPSHTHSGTTAGDYPDHVHGTAMEVGFGDGGSQNYWTPDFWGDSAPAGYGTIYTQGASARHVHNFTTGGVNANHTHTITPAGQDQFHENRPPYYALAYIMKI